MIKSINVRKSWVSLLYGLLRDVVPCGEMERLVHEFVEKQPASPGDAYTNKHLEAYAREIVGRVERAGAPPARCMAMVDPVGWAGGKSEEDRRCVLEAGHDTPMSPDWPLWRPHVTKDKILWGGPKAPAELKPVEIDGIPSPLPDEYRLVRSVAEFRQIWPDDSHPHASTVEDILRKARGPLIVSAWSIHTLSEWRHIYNIARTLK